MKEEGYNNFGTFTKSLVFGSEKHKDQRRKAGDIPYINHPIEVANILSQCGIQDYEVLAAAILHDVIEDTQTTEQELQVEFGNRIKGLVLQCSDDKSLGKVERKRVQIVKACLASEDARAIKIADKLSNCWDLHRNPPPKWSPERVRGYFLWAFAVCKNLRGFNNCLDDRLDKLFSAVGVSQIDGEQMRERLEEYYKILGEDKSQK